MNSDGTLSSNMRSPTQTKQKSSICRKSNYIQANLTMMIGVCTGVRNVLNWTSPVIQNRVWSSELNKWLLNDIVNRIIVVQFAITIVTHLVIHMIIDYWLLMNDYWLLIIDYCLIRDYRLLIIDYWLLTIDSLLLIIDYWL